MRVGILGSGLMGGKLGTILARAGHEVVFSYARSNDKLKKLARDAQGNARAGTPRDAAHESDALLLAVHWSRMDDVLNQAGDLSGKAIITCSLPMNDDNTKPCWRTRRRARRNLPGDCRRRGLSVHSTPFRVRCFSVCTKASERLRDRVWFTAVMTRTAKVWPLS
jgi:hypothetical protein